MYRLTEKIEVDFCFSFLGHPELDSRIINFYKSLKKRNLSVAVIGYDWLNEGKKFEMENYFLNKIKRRPALFFYLKFSLILKKRLEKVKSKIYVAEDIYTLPFVYKIAKKNNARLYYDSRELYNNIGGLKNKPIIQKLISFIERRFIENVDKIIVTGEMDLKVLSEFYDLPKEKFLIIRNLPYRRKIFPIDLRAKFSINKDDKILIYQGILSNGRGIEKTILALNYLQNVVFVILGSGPLLKKLQYLVKINSLESRVIFAGNIRNDELLNYTAGADIGISLIENISKSYYYALPNKLFEYIFAGLPVVVSPLPQMIKIVREFDVGIILKSLEPQEIADEINFLINNNSLFVKLKQNTQHAADILNWEREFENIENQFLRLSK